METLDLLPSYHIANILCVWFQNTEPLLQAFYNNAQSWSLPNWGWERITLRHFHLSLTCEVGTIPHTVLNTPTDSSGLSVHRYTPPRQWVELHWKPGPSVQNRWPEPPGSTNISQKWSWSLSSIFCSFLGLFRLKKIVQRKALHQVNPMSCVFTSLRSRNLVSTWTEAEGTDFFYWGLQVLKGF